ncbi:MAG: serine hydrolase [Nannocystaceae bacterium]
MNTFPSHLSPTSTRFRRVRRTFASLSLAVLCSLAPTGAHAFDVNAPTIGEGHADLVDVLDPIITQFAADNQLPGIQVAVSKDGRIVFNKAYGMANVATNEPMQTYHRNRIGSVSKIVSALTALKLAETINPNLSLLDKPIYGPTGLLPSTEPEYAQLIEDQLRGQQRHTPVVGTFIAEGTDYTYTYYDDIDPTDASVKPTYSIGRTYNLDSISEGNEYELPPGQTVRDIRGMAGSVDGFVYTWYANGSLSKGTFEDLDSEIYIDTENGVTGVKYPEGQRADFLVGIGIAKTSGKAYAWFEDGTRAYGTPMDLRENVGTPYTAAPGHESYDIRSMAIASNDRVYAFYGDDQVSAGSSLDLDKYRTLYDTSIASNIDAQPWVLWHGAVTLRHLLSHTSGIRKNASAIGGAMMFHPNETPSDAARDLGVRDHQRYALSATDMIYEPGTDWEYSNHGARVAGWALEEFLNMPFKAIADLLVLDPLGLDMKRAWDPLDAGDASPHRPDKNSGEPIACFASCEVDVDYGEQSGYLTASADDLVRLMLATDQNPNHDDILLASTLNTMELSKIAGSLMGWRSGTSKLQHSGSCAGGGSSIAKYTGGALGGITVAVVINVMNDTNVTALRNEVAAETSNIVIPPGYDLF